MMLRVVGSVVVGACAAPDEPVQSSLDVPLVSPGGQGQDYQGFDYQGQDYQGQDYQGTALDGTDLGGGSLVDGSVDGTALIAWRLVAGGKKWEQLFPDKICTWNFLRTGIPTCTSVDLTVSPSPLAGSTWPATFLDENGNPHEITFQIGTAAGRQGSVRKDTETAMHALKGASSCTLDRTAACGNANGCRVNCDLWLYEVKADIDGDLRSLCGRAELAYAIDGTYDETGEHTTSNGRFTFACPKGTIAKCTRWGYRPFGSARRCNEQEQCEPSAVELAPYHQACVRAAAADYCANGHSFTKNGTLIDIWDYMAYDPNPNAPHAGFVPRTSNLRWHEDDRQRTDALLYEAEFDRYGASAVNDMRYTELGSIFSEYGCRTDFDLPVIDSDGTLLKAAWRQPPRPAPTPPFIGIDSTPRCAHSEHTIGGPLHRLCSPCTQQLWQHFGLQYEKCTTTTWDDDCKRVTTQGVNGVGPCLSGDRMARHSECVPGNALSRYDSGCTLRICLDPTLASCCTGTWSSTCVAAANTRCTGGQETPLRGFCGNSLPTEP